MLMLIYDSKQNHQELHTSERTIVPRTVIFDIDIMIHGIGRLIPGVRQSPGPKKVVLESSLFTKKCYL